LIASAASVLTVPEYYARVIPENQNFDEENYAGKSKRSCLILICTPLVNFK